MRMDKKPLNDLHVTVTDFSITMDDSYETPLFCVTAEKDMRVASISCLCLNDLRELQRICEEAVAKWGGE